MEYDSGLLVILHKSRHQPHAFTLVTVTWRSPTYRGAVPSLNECLSSRHVPGGVRGKFWSDMRGSPSWLLCRGTGADRGHPRREIPYSRLAWSACLFSHPSLCRPFLSLHLIRIRSSVWSAVLWYVLLSFCSRRSGPVCTFPLFFMVWLHRRHWSAGISARVSSSIDRWKDKRSSQRLMADARRYRMPPQLGKGFGS